MAFKLGGFFPKKSVNEPYLSLDDPRWGELEGGYRSALYDASAALKRLEAVNDIESTKKVYQELWDNLHH